jgi:hypothetical protein
VSFQQRSLHWLGEETNPYEEAMSIIARTLQSFDDDGLIPVFGFGDGRFEYSCGTHFLARSPYIVSE